MLSGALIFGNTFMCFSLACRVSASLKGKCRENVCIVQGISIYLFQAEKKYLLQGQEILTRDKQGHATAKSLLANMFTRCEFDSVS